MITFRVVTTSAGWSIVGSNPMSTVYLSQKAAIEHANEMAAVMRGHGEQVTVLVEDEQAVCSRD
ncbi:MAG: hypothetical protein ACHP7N_15385 [Caulobacterales bacterium]